MSAKHKPKMVKKLGRGRARATASKSRPRVEIPPVPFSAAALIGVADHLHQWWDRLSDFAELGEIGPQGADAATAGMLLHEARQIIMKMIDRSLKEGLVNDAAYRKLLPQTGGGER